MDSDSDGFGPVDNANGAEEKSLPRNPDLPNLFEDDDDMEPIAVFADPVSVRPVATASSKILESVIQAAVKEVTRSKLATPWDNYFANKFPSISSGLAPSLVLPKFLRDDFVLPTVPVVPAQTAMKIASGSLMRAAVARVQVVPWPEQCAAARAKALQRWRLILEENLASSDLGRNLHRMAVSLEPDSKLTELVDDTFADRKATTLNKRAGPILKYLMWHRTQYGTPGLPLDENRCYLYIKTLRTGPATSGKSFLSALTFAHYVIKMSGAKEVIESARIKGVAHSMYSKKRPLKQRRPLRVAEVKSLEKLAQYAEHGWDRYFACFLLLLIFLRARYNDVAKQKKILPDFHAETGGYLEIEVLDSKTQRSAESKTAYLPLVGPALGISGCKWGIRLLQERREQQIENFCLMPTPSLQGGWLDAPLELSSANKWMRDLLKLTGHHAQLDEIGSHSCKATALSWCAKAGIDIVSRSLLGYHSVKQLGTVVVYSRDIMAQPLRELDRVLEQIRAKEFFPDETRSGRVTKKPTAPGQSSSKAVDDESDFVLLDLDADKQRPLDVTSSKVQSDTEVPAQDDAESSSSENSSSDSSTGDGTTDVQAYQTLARVRPKVPDVFDDKVAYYHVTSCILHFRNHNDPRLKCGRTISDNILPIAWDKSPGLIRCMRCFSKA